MTGDDVLVEPAEDVGWPELAAALAERDPAVISGVLQRAWVLVPVRRSAGGEREIRLYSSAGDSLDDRGREGWELPLFSSTATLWAFLADDPERQFDFVRATSLSAFLESGRGTIARVVFDPAGPHAVAASVDDVISALGGQTDTASPLIGEGLHPKDRVLDLDLPLGDDWFRVDLTATSGRNAQLTRLVDQQLQGLSVGPALRAQLHQWLRRVTSAAAGGGGRETAFLVRRSDTAALALSVTRYWQPLLAGHVRAPLDAIAQKLQAKRTPQDEVLEASTPGGRLLRHTRLTAGSAELRAENLDVLAIDYWLEFPDGKGLCLISFSTPHVDIRGTVLTLTDQIVLESAWVVAGPEQTQP